MAPQGTCTPSSKPRWVTLTPLYLKWAHLLCVNYTPQCRVKWRKQIIFLAGTNLKQLQGTQTFSLPESTLPTFLQMQKMLVLK